MIAAGLVAGPFQQDQIRPIDMHHVAVFHVAVGGYILINGILIMSHFLGEQLPKKTVRRYKRISITCRKNEQCILNR